MNESPAHQISGDMSIVRDSALMFVFAGKTVQIMADSFSIR